MFCSLNILTEWFEKSSAVTIFVAVLLSLYFISTFWIFFYRFFFLNGWLKKEKDSSDAFLLGGKVYKNKYPEIGWYPIEIDNKEKIFKNIPKEIMAFHYHGDTFSIPDGGKRIATNIHTENQAFSYKDKIFGFQFHLEMTETTIKEILEKYYDFVPEQEKAVQNKKEILNYTKKYLPETKKILFTILENLTLL